MFYKKEYFKLKKIKPKSLAASTLVEVLIAMVIIMVVFTTAIQIFNNVLYSGVSIKKIQVEQQLNILTNSVKQKGYQYQNELIVDSVVYSFNIDSTRLSGLTTMEITGKLNNKILGRTRFIYKNDEQ
ncbi:hypothetical protein [Pedobacter nototheniae]|uniref:hypothetical protein n=1 Tax=Pedobacter nototheniae TaxID=2488994 RepID=UPI00103A51DF|nr:MULTISPECIES: hypothetical protein [Pedobacter]